MRCDRRSAFWLYAVASAGSWIVEAQGALSKVFLHTIPEQTFVFERYRACAAPRCRCSVRRRRRTTHRRVALRRAHICTRAHNTLAQHPPRCRLTSAKSDHKVGFQEASRYAGRSRAPAFARCLHPIGPCFAERYETNCALVRDAACATGAATHVQVPWHIRRRIRVDRNVFLASMGRRPVTLFRHRVIRQQP